MRNPIVSTVLMAALLLPSSGLCQGSRLSELMEKAKKKPAKAATPEAAEQAVPAVSTGAIREEYSINAQYRGTVKKAFMDIGRATVTFDTKSGTDFNVKANGAVTDPEDSKYRYELDVDADFRVEGTRVTQVADRSKFNADAERHRERVLKDLPFIYIVKFTPYPKVSQKDTAWTIGTQEFVLRHVKTEENEVQVTILERGGMIGKIFLDPSDSLPHAIKKFRVMGTNDVVLSFVRSQGSAAK